MRVVLDTNVLVSVALPGSRLFSLIEAWRARRCRPVLSQEILEEYLRVLTYPKFSLSSRDVTRLLEEDFLLYAEFVRVTSRIDVITVDPEDNKFLACVVDGRADVLVSGDHHLLDLRRFRSIPIMSPRQFLGHLTAEDTER